MHRLTTKQADAIRRLIYYRDRLDEFRNTLTNAELAQSIGVSTSLLASVISNRAYPSPNSLEEDEDMEQALHILWNQFKRQREEIK